MLRNYFVIGLFDGKLGTGSWNYFVLSLLLESLIFYLHYCWTQVNLLEDFWRTEICSYGIKTAISWSISLVFRSLLLSLRQLQVNAMLLLMIYCLAYVPISLAFCQYYLYVAKWLTPVRGESFKNSNWARNVYYMLRRARAYRQMCWWREVAFFFVLLKVRGRCHTCA